MPNHAIAWGSRGHEIIADFGSSMSEHTSLVNCHITADQLSEHSTDPDLKWRNDRRRHPDEAIAHFFHIDKQPADWRTRSEPKDPTQGRLVYRILAWFEKAKQQRAASEWSELAETLYGLVHYVGDLTMPLHLTSQHDGEEVGLPELHKQWESKMIHRYEKDIRKALTIKFKSETIPITWSKLKYDQLIFNIAEQSYSKTNRLFEHARGSLLTPHASARAHRGYNRGLTAQPRFSKPLLYNKTGSLAEEQLALAARLWAHTLNFICR